MEPQGPALEAANRLRRAIEPQMRAMLAESKPATRPAAAAVTISADDWRALAQPGQGPEEVRPFATTQPQERMLIPVMILSVPPKR